MQRFSLGVRTSGVTSATAAWEIRTAANRRAYLKEIGIFLAAATASVYAIGRPAAIGVTPGTTDDFRPEDPANVVVANDFLSALTWGTGPTAPTSFLRRIALPASVGAGVIWTFPEGLVIPVSSSLVLWNLAANGVVDAYAVIEG